MRNGKNYCSCIVRQTLTRFRKFWSSWTTIKESGHTLSKPYCLQQQEHPYGNRSLTRQKKNVLRSFIRATGKSTRPDIIQLRAAGADQSAKRQSYGRRCRNLLKRFSSHSKMSKRYELARRYTEKYRHRLTACPVCHGHVEVVSDRERVYPPGKRYTVHDSLPPARNVWAVACETRGCECTGNYTKVANAVEAWEQLVEKYERSRDG